MPVPSSLKSILWEYDLDKLDFKSNIVAERVMNLWDSNVINLWISSIWKNNAKKSFLKNSNKLDKKSLNYWKIYFNLKDSEILIDNRSMYEKLNKPIFSRSFR